MAKVIKMCPSTVLLSISDIMTSKQGWESTKSIKFQNLKQPNSKTHSPGFLPPPPVPLHKMEQKKRKHHISIKIIKKKQLQNKKLEISKESSTRRWEGRNWWKLLPCGTGCPPTNDRTPVVVPIWTVPFNAIPSSSMPPNISPKRARISLFASSHVQSGENATLPLPSTEIILWVILFYPTAAKPKFVVWFEAHVLLKISKVQLYVHSNIRTRNERNGEKRSRIPRRHPPKRNSEKLAFHSNTMYWCTAVIRNVASSHNAELCRKLWVYVMLENAGVSVARNTGLDVYFSAILSSWSACIWDTSGFLLHEPSYNHIGKSLQFMGQVSNAVPFWTYPFRHVAS